MNHHKYALILLATAFLLFNLINPLAFNQYRMDLTEDQLYSLSPATELVLEQLSGDITLYWITNIPNTKSQARLLAYEQRVYNLLKQYLQRSKGKLRLIELTPTPFSPEEAIARELGVSNQTQQGIYLGLAGKNELDQVVSIDFFDPNLDQSLEYRLSQLIVQLSDLDAGKITIVDPLSVTPQQRIFSQLQQEYGYQHLTGNWPTLPESQLILLIQPQHLTADQWYQVDQYLMLGGTALVFLEKDDGWRAEHEEILLQWGLQLHSPNNTLNWQATLDLHPEATPTRSLEAVWVKDPQSLSPFSGRTNQVSPLAWLPSEETQSEPEAVVMQVTGRTVSAFNQYADDNKLTNHLPETSQSNLVVVADVNLLQNDMWLASNGPKADNQQFVANLVEQLLGSSRLIDLRSRGQYGRPFTVIENLKATIQSQQQSLEDNLWQSLADLEAQAANPQQDFANAREREQVENQYLQEKVNLLNELHRIRLQSQIAISDLSRNIKIFTILVAPLALTLLLWLLVTLGLWRSRR